jgi:phosphoribosylanthranilate isomerase
MTRVKVCGVADLGDAQLAVDLGAWAVGMVFHAESPRACDPGTAELIGSELKRRAEVVGVFVNWPLDELEHMADRAQLTMLQLHGDEGPVYCREAARKTGCRVMKAVRAKDAAAVRKLVSYREVDLHMLDAHSESARGGTGETFDWELTSYHRSPVPLVLSGGLDPGNVGEAIERVLPYAVDSASGTEAEPGRKDPDKLRALFEAVQQADARRAA